ncbi:12973_t:CDS:2 [Funneliformis caledonium]|uniref:12973_t:CDS:1 n=1 Tax=Funneliformis caledonium TaxID=1117310 RepID=A0A9N9B0N2_9GLOM|nr:12973_t:CDS:2 [Funneliformis caledonium]
MELPTYDGNIHPNIWLKQVQAHCFLKQITKDEEILKFAKLVINPTIDIPKDIATLNELVNALKKDISFTIFKNTNVWKLQLLKYVPDKEGGETSKFISNFRQLCYNAEINDIKEQMKYLSQSFPNGYFLTEFFKRRERINHMNVLIKEFEEIVMDESKLIKNGSFVTFKHVTTGKYLSSIDNLCYTTGSRSQLVFANNLLNTDVLWKVIFTSDKELASYSDTINLRHKNSNKLLGIPSYYKSPVTGHTEVDFLGYNTQWKFKKSKLKNFQGYLKSNTIINILNSSNQEILRSHDFQFTINNDKFQEVVCHLERLGGNDKWCIELYE